MANLKAYQIDGDENSVIVFAKHDVVARRKGAGQLDQDFESVRCRRVASYDKFAGKGFVPTDVLVSGGWWFECSGCSLRITSDHEDDDGNEITPIYCDHEVWCSARCQAAYLYARHREALTRAAIPRWLRRKWPRLIEVSNVSASFWSAGDRCAYGYFTFPGSQGSARIDIRLTRREAEEERKKGGKVPRLWIEHRDLKAWHEFAGAPEVANA